MKNISLTFLVIMIILATSSCKKSDIANNAGADVFVRSLMYNGQLAYSTVFSATSGLGMTAVTVDVPGFSSISLADHIGDGTAFFKDTSMTPGPYSFTPPDAGIYTFHLTFNNGEQKVYTNSLSGISLLPPVIDSLYRKPFGVNQSIRLKWEPVVGAQDYQIRISSGENEIQPWGFNTTAGSPLTYESGIWNFSRYLPGTLLFEVRAILYEPSDVAHLQAISQTSASIDL